MINASAGSNAPSFFRCVLAGSGCTAHMRRATPAPPRNLTLHAFFKQPQKDGSNRPAVEESALIASRPRADTEVGPSAHVRTMQNTGNTCYVNATLQSLVAVLGADDTSAELEPTTAQITTRSSGRSIPRASFLSAR